MNPAVPLIRVLAVDDRETDLELYRALLARPEADGDETFEVDFARSIKEARIACRAKEYDIVLLDLMLPDATHLDGLTRLLSVPAPIIMVSGEDNERIATEAIGLGAEDYIVKDEVNRKRLRRAIKYVLNRWRSRSGVKPTELETNILAQIAEIKTLKRQWLEKDRPEILGNAER